MNMSFILARIPQIFQIYGDSWTKDYAQFPEKLRLEMLDETRQMFTFGYDSYMKYAFPLDELDPIHCTGRGPDYENPSNININDVLGDYSLGLVDVLDTLAIMGNKTEFQKAVKLVLDHVSFDKPNTVQVFEANIRVLGGLLSAHLLMEDLRGPFCNMTPEWYMGDLLTLAHDLADRLILAFDQTNSGLPHPRVHLIDGVPENGRLDTCTAGAGSLLLELGVISRLLGDPVYESLARRAVQSLWTIRNNDTGLFGTNMNIQSGQWISNMSGLGAGMDSFYEYLLKSHILFGDKDDLNMFNQLYGNIKTHLRKGREYCNDGVGPHPFYVNVDLTNGNIANHWIDSLQAAFPGVQVLFGDLDEAICHHAVYFAIWKKYGCLPERFNWKLNGPDVKFYPLRPEFMESTYLLYQATKNPFYLHVGKEILSSLNKFTKVQCGYATVHDVETKTLEDRQESFFLSETCKYLYLLFDTENHINKNGDQYIFTTEGHVFPVREAIRSKIWETDYDFKIPTNKVAKNDTIPPNSYSDNCQNVKRNDGGLPLQSDYLAQIFHQIGAEFS